LIGVIKLAHRELRRWGIERPRIAVAALNPHGAEGAFRRRGSFGDYACCRSVPQRRGNRRARALSADTVFLRASRGEFDAVVSCYHDQAMIPVKCLSFGEAVNVTLGLPFIRTSVDHGTAFDIAGKGIAEHSSMVAAIQLAAQLFVHGDEGNRAVEV
jgi:4-hydroxythreonine-4-phosphate dehydrogenase